MKRKLLIIALCMVLLTMSVAGSLAYFSEKSEIVHNIITTGSVEIEINETDENGDPFEDVEGAMPGGSYGKVVTVKNTGAGAAHVRMLVSTSVTMADGTQGDVSLITLDINTTDWELKDGYYYYKSALAPGEETVPLFTEVSISGDMDNDYQNCRISVDVSAQAVQSANNGESALTAKGWPEA